MSDTQLRSEIDSIVKKSGFTMSREMICPLMRIVSMRHSDVAPKQIHNVLKSLL